MNSRQPKSPTRPNVAVTKIAASTVEALECRLFLDATAPFQAAAVVSDITSSGPAVVPIVVRYFEPTVDPSTLGDANLQVAGPHGFSAPVHYVGLDSTDPGAGHGVRIADYTFAAPSGGWQAANNGSYEVVAIANQVKDTQDGFLPPGSIDDFTVRVPVAPTFAVSVDGSAISSGQVVDWGTSPGVSKTVTVTNTGSDPAALAVTITSVNNQQLLSVGGYPNLSTIIIQPGASQSFTVTSTAMAGAASAGASLGSVVLASGAALPFIINANAVPPTAAVTPVPLPAFGNRVFVDPSTAETPFSAAASPTGLSTGSKTTTLLVAYSGQQPDVSTFGDGNLLMSGPNGFLAPAHYVGLDASDQGISDPTRWADYTVAAPDGAWSSSADGSYYIIANPNQVKDPALGYLPSGLIAAFPVNIPAPVPVKVTVDGQPFADGQSLSFGSTQPSVPSQVHTITLTNTSADPQVLSLSSQQGKSTGPGGLQTGVPVFPTFFINQSGNSPFAGTEQLAAPVPPGESITIPLTFDPQQQTPAGAVSVPYTITANSTISPSPDPQITPGAQVATFSLNAEGTVIAASTAANAVTSTLTQAAHGKPITFIDASGKKVFVRLAGPGKLQLQFSTAQPTHADPADIILTGTTARSSLNISTNAAMTISGLTDSGALGILFAPTATLTGVFSFAGSVNAIIAGSIGSGFSANIGGALGALRVRGSAGGNLAAASIKAIVAGSLNSARYLAGASFGTDGQPGGGDDTGGAGSLGSLLVRGDVTSSIVAAGLDPVDGVFFNGNDILTGGGASKFGPVVIRGALSSDSQILGGTFSSVRVSGRKINPASDARFHLG